MAQNNTLRSWIKQQPVPHRIHAEYDDGSERVFKLNDSRSRIRDAENMLKGAIMAEALDSDEEVIRVWHAEPNAKVVATVDNPLVMVSKVASLLVDAADRAAERHSDAYRLAFEAQNALLTRVLDMMTQQTQRMSEIEDAYHERVMAEGDAIAPVDPAGESTKLVKHILEVAAPVVMHSLMKGDDKPPSNGSS